jgi:hypothetical protein
VLANGVNEMAGLGSVQVRHAALQVEARGAERCSERIALGSNSVLTACLNALGRGSLP